MTQAITKIEVTDDITLVTIENIPLCVKTVARFFTNLEKANISIDMISRAPTAKETGNISFTISDSDFTRTAMIANELKAEIEDLIIKVDTGNTKINLYGEPMSTKPGVAAGVFRSLTDIDGLRIKLITTSEVDISLLTSQSDSDLALASIKNQFNL